MERIKELVSRWSSYQSVKFIRVQDPTLAMVYYSLTFALIGYVLIYTVYIKKGYQEYDTLVGSTVVKVKGSAYSGNYTNPIVYDEYDLVQPPIQPGAVFITTNMKNTYNQTRGFCAGNLQGTTSETDETCSCSYANNVNDCCSLGVLTENGMKMGRCADGTYCELSTWCPLESPATDNLSILDDVRNFTVFVRVSIQFPNFGAEWSNSQLIQMGVNLFYLQDIVNNAKTDFDDIKAKGCVILMSWSFQCDLNYDISNCNPIVSYVRLDPTSGDSTGFNFRYTKSFWDSEGIEHRNLIKVYGVNLLFKTIGQAGKFSVTALTLTIGSGLGILTLSTVFCDLVMQYLVPEKKTYKQEKFQEVLVKSDNHNEEGTEMEEMETKREKKKEEKWAEKTNKKRKEKKKRRRKTKKDERKTEKER